MPASQRRPVGAAGNEPRPGMKALDPGRGLARDGGGRKHKADQRAEDGRGAARRDCAWNQAPEVSASPYAGTITLPRRRAIHDPVRHRRLGVARQSASA